MDQDWRYERKFQSEQLDARRLLHIVKLHPYGFREVYPERRVNNIYYDTDSLRHYHQHVEGHSNRNKIRVRWYGDGKEQIIPILEIKFKKGLLNSKHRQKLNPIDLERWKDQGYRMAYLASLNEIDKIYSHLQPTLYNSYLRKYFISFDSMFRLTIDSELRYLSVDRDDIIKTDVVILELKYSGEQEAYADKIGTPLPIRLSKFSKYVDGIVKLGVLVQGKPG